jgi:hypothetical protein
VALTKEQINFLNKVCGGRKNWKMNKGKVDFVSSGAVDMENMNLTEIPIKFGVVGGSFFCGINNLTTLKNCPDYIEGNFYFPGNNLTEYFKNIKEEDLKIWKNFYWAWVFEEYPFLINIGKNYFDRERLKYYLNEFPQTKIYLE